ncbi:MAG: bifunctional acetaldehyde-CoA/alcohol dehydrogenase [Oscillospiraceae bacterium]|jgi:acetaldehyde dehydrogenase/alcohol dehydrogenase|nr:bifunctional acetaldehyde-CoA/alcohol dehydrogenase [Oscillospiraceae bacterium]
MTKNDGLLLKNTSKTENMENTINSLVGNAKAALDEYMNLDQIQVDNIVEKMTLAVIDNCVKISKLAIQETARGVFEDKILKNMFASEYVADSLKNKKTVGLLWKNEFEGYAEIAEPVGVVAGITPVTNPTSTVIFKSIICAKTRNPLIFGFHPSSLKCCSFTAKILLDAAVKAGAPKSCISWIDKPSLEATSLLMNHDGVSLVLATGGSGLVKSAYSAGKPALGVGPGNVPCYVEKSADIKRACTDIIISKTFDNGMICASEQSVLVDKEIFKVFEKIMKENGCFFLNVEETKKVSNYVMCGEKCKLNPAIVGQTAEWIASQSGVLVDKNTKILIAKLNGVGKNFPLSYEKLSPLLAYYIVKNSEEAFKIAVEILNAGGIGHSATIHSKNKEIISKFGMKMPVARIICNSPSSHAAIGGIYNLNIPSLTLGCGSYGRNSTSSNVSFVNLINKKRVDERKRNMLDFDVKSKIHFENGCISYFEHANMNKVFIVTNEKEINQNIEEVFNFLRKKRSKVSWQIFSVSNEFCSAKDVMLGREQASNFSPDTIVALGDDVAINVAKAIRFVHENPNISLKDASRSFMDINKRVYSTFKINKSLKFIAVPTNFNADSAISNFVIVKDEENVNYTMIDRNFCPDAVIIDSKIAVNLTQNQIALNGLNILINALESFVSVKATDFTDAFALKAIQIIFSYLKIFCNDINDIEAREKICIASCMSGIAFNNAFLGLNNSMANSLQRKYNISHNAAAAVLLPYIIKFNSQIPTKFVSFSSYEKFIADKKYEEIAKILGIAKSSTRESVDSLIFKVRDFMKSLGVLSNISMHGVDKKVFLQDLMLLSEEAFLDKFTATNPRYPLVNEISEIFQEAF